MVAEGFLLLKFRGIFSARAQHRRIDRAVTRLLDRLKRTSATTSWVAASDKPVQRCRAPQSESTCIGQLVRAISQHNGKPVTSDTEDGFCGQALRAVTSHRLDASCYSSKVVRQIGRKGFLAYTKTAAKSAVRLRAIRNRLRMTHE